MSHRDDNVRTRGTEPSPVNFDQIRTRLAGLEGRTYWRSLEEVADTDEFKGYIGQEFPAQASEFTDPAGRRQFLKLMGASLALAGVSACTRQPDEMIVPYVRQPEEIIPGRPLFYATAMQHGGFAMPLLAENHMGRPTKLEGNPEHPASLGATDIFGQASVLSLYDPDRSRTIVGRGEVKTWSAFLNALQAVMNSQRAIKGQSLRILTEPVTSPSLINQMQTLLAAMPLAKWHQWDPVFGTVQGGAPAAAPVYRFDKAEVVVSLDADFLGFGPGAVRYTKDFSARRRITSPEEEANRLYVVEPVPTITGGKANHRLPMKARDVHAFAQALASAVGVAGATAGALDNAQAQQWIPAIAADLHAHRGRAVVVAGERQPAAVHAMARAINESLGNVGTTVTYMAPLAATPADGCESLGKLIDEMNGDDVDVLIILESNPVFTAPADLNFTAALEKVATRIHCGLYNDETAEHCHWHVPAAHYLESWGDARSFDGTVSLIQPLIAPLYDGRQAIEILAAVNGTPGLSPMEMVKDYWMRAFDGKTKFAWSLRDRDGKPFENVDKLWRHGLHDGFFKGNSAFEAGSTGSAGEASPKPEAKAGIEIIFRPDPTILDGRYANNGWLQELPKPVSKLTWDSAAFVSPRTAQNHSLANEDLIDIKLRGKSIRMPVWIMPGTADDTVAVHLGYGRTKVGRVGNGVGHDAFGIRTAAAPWFDGGAEIVRTGESYPLAATQNHFAMEARNPVRVVTAKEYRDNPKAIEHLGPERPPLSLTLYPVREYNGDKWGMSIDLNACTGCTVCVAACVAENNIAVVGKTQVKRTREMHWIRVDTYFEGGLDAPTGMFSQPVPCQQCENAPCEVVCPVAATTHNDEGLNDMVYNRCVGTRYCSNNCPYKVRRFNFMLYSDFVTPELEPQRNPDVTIRSRGVMEKCTYCVQRISHARIDAKTAGRAIKDGDIKTACQQACPADAIVFGNLNDPESQLSKLVKQERNYGLLEELGSRPRTTYLGIVRNPNTALKS